MAPLLKQKLAFQKVLKGKPISHAMREVGYAPSTAATTTKLTASKGWQELVEKYLPEEKLAKVHSEGLKATKSEVRLTGRGESELVDVPDFGVRHKYLETGYKLRSRLNPESAPTTTVTNLTQIIINPPHAADTGNKSDPETVPSLASPSES